MRVQINTFASTHIDHNQTNKPVYVSTNNRFMCQNNQQTNRFMCQTIYVSTKINGTYKICACK